MTNQTDEDQLLTEARRTREAVETIRTLLIFLALVGLLLAGAALRYLAAG